MACHQKGGESPALSHVQEGMWHATKNPSSAQTNAALVPARAGKFAILKGVYISSDTAMTVSIVNSATHSLVWRCYVGQNGGVLVGMTPAHGLGDSLLGEGFDYTTSANGNVFIDVAYAYNS